MMTRWRIQPERGRKRKSHQVSLSDFFNLSFWRSYLLSFSKIASALDTNFKQQRLKAWQPILTASTALLLFFVIGVVFIPIGAVLLVTSDKVSTISPVEIIIWKYTVLAVGKNAKSVVIILNS